MESNCILPDLERSDHEAAKEVTRYITNSVQCMLWGKAAGRCEFKGCSKPLWKSSVTNEEINIAQKAHIYAFSSGGARSNTALEKKEDLNSLSNLMLVCHECHQKIDKSPDGGRYTAELLRSWKADHELRMELITGIKEERKSHLLIYGSNVGQYNSPLSYEKTASALFPDYYPATDVPLTLGVRNSLASERDPTFWASESENLRKQYEHRIRERLSDGEIEHLSVFSLAPQPLLIQLGTLVGDIVPSEVFQLHREPPTWKWPPISDVQSEFSVKRIRGNGAPALVLALSATINVERIYSVLEDSDVWIVAAANPHNDIIKSRTQLSELRTIFRRTFDQIKAEHGQHAILHIFPAAPISVCVELGRVRMPKADMTWMTYDQINQLGGFIPAIQIS